VEPIIRIYLTSYMTPYIIIRDGQLAKTLEKKLAEEGVNAGVEAFNFVLTPDSLEEFDALKTLSKEETIINADRTDRPRSDFLEKFKPDCVPQIAPRFYDGKLRRQVQG
ncbi:MAG: hypothetical protein IKH41_01730, partial [Clostridia bacterium]|nr:hypothetical protein [Clostridia bacterium]